MSFLASEHLPSLSFDMKVSKLTVNSTKKILEIKVRGNYIILCVLAISVA